MADQTTTLALPERLTLAEADQTLVRLGGELAQQPGAVVVVNAGVLKVFDSSALAVLLELSRRLLAQGKTLSDEMAGRRYAIISPLAIKMIAAGERTGKLGETFIYLETFFEAEADRKIKNLTVLFEPALLLVIGALVVFLALAILTPIYSLTGSVRR